ncbi:DUF72 domain-containing protein [Pedobacter agri]|uniref:DUF72 domain-containing protein n=1 Tax=Pedobacter agri TaxID=454586 RepID=UPI00292E395C|nr:DUF72 domain-containing protein [Pedobacter agri]
MENTIGNYYTGTSGLLLPVPNKAFYPKEYQERSRLCYYGSLMNSIEVNSTFYKMPQASTIKRWYSEVPNNFKFTFKLFKEITHRKNLAFNPVEIHQFFEVINHIEEKRGCLLVQFPPSVRIGQFKQIQILMAELRNGDQNQLWKIAIEFRHPSLYVEEVSKLLAEYNMASVIHDKAYSASPMQMSDAPFVYLRFHGPGGNYKGSYSESLLSEYASYVKDWMEEGKTIFAYFNNTMGDAHGNLSLLQSLVKESMDLDNN